MSKETFEFMCGTAGGGCGGYLRARMRTNINGNYTIVCPKCGHRHNRQVRNGQITGGRCNGEAGRGETDEIHVPMSAYSEEPILEASKGNETATLVEGAKEKKKGFAASIWGRFSGRRQ
jgi:hypothetical protein